jgi:hypothetical protein
LHKDNFLTEDFFQAKALALGGDEAFGPHDLFCETEFSWSFLSATKKERLLAVGGTGRRRRPRDAGPSIFSLPSD